METKLSMYIKCLDYDENIKGNKKWCGVIGEGTSETATL